MNSYMTYNNSNTNHFNRVFKYGLKIAKFILQKFNNGDFFQHNGVQYHILKVIIKHVVIPFKRYTFKNVTNLTMELILDTK